MNRNLTYVQNGRFNGNLLAITEDGEIGKSYSIYLNDKLQKTYTSYNEAKREYDRIANELSKSKVRIY